LKSNYKTLAFKKQNPTSGKNIELSFIVVHMRFIEKAACKLFCK